MTLYNTIATVAKAISNFAHYNTYFSVFAHSQAVEYLNKVEGFKNFGFSEKKIHDAFEKSGQDWDKALDILTEDR